MKPWQKEIGGKNMVRVRIALLLSLFCAFCAAGCSQPHAPSVSSPSSALSLSLTSKQGQHCNMTFGDQKETFHVAGIITKVSDQWIVLNNVGSGQTVNGTATTQEVWVPAQKVLLVEFDPVLPGHQE